MAVIAVTPANVAAGSGAVIRDVTAGATILAGEVVYSDSTDSNQYKLADANVAAATADAVGIALNNADDGQPLRIQTGGNINPGGTVVVGEVYMVSTTAGEILDITSLAPGDYPTILGVGTTATNLKLSINAAGVVAAAGVFY